ncbi:MAG TPA: thrombospondin type 3 repeat-containing protein, partial [Verrucomicrobiae bacterium]
PGGASYFRNTAFFPTWTLSSPGDDLSFRTYVDTGTGDVGEPAWVVADDFRSDGRPINCVRWWGSYLGGSTNGFEDGFVLSFFSDVPLSATNAFSRPGNLLGTYFAPGPVVSATDTGYIGWDGYEIWCYTVSLPDTCLEHAVTNLATPTAFLERSNTIYWLAISAEAGNRPLRIRGEDGVIRCWSEPSGKSATNHFWGWHTSPTNWNDTSVMGLLRMEGMNWLYDDWMPNNPFHMERDMAFELLTFTNPPPPVAEGIDLFTTAGGGTTFQNLDDHPIPADFFGPGSDPFAGTIPLQGFPLQTEPPGIISPADTIVQRLAPAHLSADEFDTVPIRIGALSLASSSPITVTYGGGAPELWNVQVCLSSDMPQPTGRMWLSANLCGDGGTFESVLPVQPRFIFRRPRDGAVRVLDYGHEGLPPLQFTISNGHWARYEPGTAGLVAAPPGLRVDHDCDPATPAIGPFPGSANNFFAGLRVDRCPSDDCDAPTQTRLRLIQATASGAGLGLLPARRPLAPDSDGDGIPDDADNCPTRPNPLQIDSDDDGVGDVCDVCQFVADPCQEDCNADGIGDACEPMLRIQSQGTNFLCSWAVCPVTPSPYVLETATTLASGAWTPVTTAPTTVGGRFVVPIPRTELNLFCRLSRHKSLCKCVELTVKGFSYSGIGTSSVQSTNTRVKFTITVKASIRCETNSNDGCEGEIRAFLLSSTWNGVGKTGESVKAGDPSMPKDQRPTVLHGTCDGKPSPEKQIKFTYEGTVLGKSSRLDGTVKIALFLICRKPGDPEILFLDIRIKPTSPDDGTAIIDEVNGDLDGDTVRNAADPFPYDPNKP